MTADKMAEFDALFKDTNPAELTRQIISIQTRLISLAKSKTDTLTAELSRAKPDEARTDISRAS